MDARTLLVAVAAISMLGCSGKVGSDGSVAFTTSVSGSIPLSRLTSGQATQLCNDVTRENTATLAPTLCASSNRSGALNITNNYLGQNPTATDAELRTECSYILGVLYPNGCAAAASCDAGYLASQPPACTATVADVADCLNGNDALYRALLEATPSCEVVTASSLTATFAPGGPYDSYLTAISTRSVSCAALLDCTGIYPINDTYPGT